MGEQNLPCIDPGLVGMASKVIANFYEMTTEGKAQYYCNKASIEGKLTYAHIAVEELAEVISETNPVKRRKELIQLAVVCVQWVEKLDRELGKNSI